MGGQYGPRRGQVKATAAIDAWKRRFALAILRGSIVTALNGPKEDR